MIFYRILSIILLSAPRNNVSLQLRYFSDQKENCETYEGIIEYRGITSVHSVREIILMVMLFRTAKRISVSDARQNEKGTAMTSAVVGMR